MRDIKFRAWDAKYNQMLYGGEIWKRYPNWYPVDYVTNKGVTIWNKRQSNDPEHTWEFQRLKMNPDILITESTGLFDKNGQPEYEGDRVKVTHSEHGWEHIGIIEYENGRFFVSCEDYAPDLVHPGHVYEIIGNIYEDTKPQQKTLPDKISAEAPPFDREDYEKLKNEHRQFQNKADQDKQELLWLEVIEDCETMAFDSMNRRNRAEALMDKFIISKK